MENYADLLFIDEVRALQERAGSAEKYQHFYTQRTKESLDESDRSFISGRESFYIASISSAGWPYVQHRGGPKGFLKILDDNHLGFADYPGNRQFITMGHSANDERVALFLMDYERRARLKLLGNLSMQHGKDAEAELIDKLSTPGQARADRVAVIDIIALDWNCPKYIPQLISSEKVHAFVNSQLEDLSQENKALRAELEKLKS